MEGCARDLFFKTEASKSFAGYTFEAVFACKILWLGLLERDYPWIVPELVVDAIRHEKIQKIVIEGRDDVEVILSNGVQVLVQLKFVKEDGDSTQDAKHYLTIAAFLLSKCPEQYYELRTTAKLVGKGKNWERDQHGIGSPALVSLIKKQDQGEPSSKKSKSGSDAMTERRKKTMQETEVKNVKRKKVLSRTQTQSIRKWLDNSENIALLKHHFFMQQLPGYEYHAQEIKELAREYVQKSFHFEQCVDLVCDILVAKVWEKVSQSVISSLEGVDGKRDTMEAYQARALDLSEILNGTITTTVRRLEEFQHSEDMRLEFKRELEALEFMMLSPESRFVRQCILGLSSIQAQPTGDHASAIVNKLFKLSEYKKE